MSSRDQILAAVQSAQPPFIELPAEFVSEVAGGIEQFQQTLQSIGGKSILVETMEEILPEVDKIFPDAKRIISAVPQLNRYQIKDEQVRHHTFNDADVVIAEAAFAVAENGAVWLTEDQYKIRVLPFIGEHLVVIVQAQNIVANMHLAYNLIGNSEYGFGVFIAGPSKTADIEQSLVMGAHGPRTMTVFIVTT